MPAATPDAACRPFAQTAEWIGLDGMGGPDVLQAGIITVQECGQSTQYLPFAVWYPAPQPQIDLAVAPGDSLEIWVWYDQQGGHAYLGNLTSGKSQEVVLPAPTVAQIGTFVPGVTAEWVVETSADPVALAQPVMSGCYATDKAGLIYSPGFPGGALPYVLQLSAASAAQATEQFVGDAAIVWTIAPAASQ